MTAKYDPAFASGLTLYVKTYSQMRAAEDNTMSLEEIIGGLVSVISRAIEQVPPGDYRRRVIKATHDALDERMAEICIPTSEAVH